MYISRIGYGDRELIENFNGKNDGIQTFIATVGRNKITKMHTPSKT